MLVICFLIVISILFIFEYREGKRNPGGARGYKLPEHARNKKMTIKLDEDYAFWNCIKDTIMLKKKQVLFEVDTDGYIVPSGLHNRPDEKIFFVGDSTVECALVDPENRYAYLVGKTLGKRTGQCINTYNMGYSGLDTNGVLRLVLTKAIPNDADIIVVQNSISELTSTLSKHIAGIDCLDGFEKHMPWLRRIKTVIATMFPSLYLNLSNAIRKKKSNEIVLTEEKEVQVVNKELILRCMEQRYLSLINLCKSYNITLFICTQLNGFSEERYESRMRKLYRECIRSNIEYDVFVELLGETNFLIRKIAKREGVGLIDLEQKIEYSPELMYDFIHYTDKGSILVGDYISEKLMHNI